MSKKIIAISREFGSGGRIIGKELAAKLGIPYYDAELLEKEVKPGSRKCGVRLNFLEFLPKLSIWKYEEK